LNQSWTVPLSSCNDLSRKTADTPLGAIGRGLIAGAVGSLAMDVLWYARYRRGGGKQHFFAWEFSSGLSSWDEAPVPGQVGKRLFEGLFQKKLPPQRAELVSNITHWAYGMLNGARTELPQSLWASRGPGTDSRSAQACGPSVTRSSRLPGCTGRSGSTTAKPWPRTSAPTWSTGPPPPPPSGSCHP
jgi:hypothetical protein